jgi:hypothetical protein
MITGTSPTCSSMTLYFRQNSSFNLRSRQWRRGTHAIGRPRAVLFRQTEIFFRQTKIFSGRQHFKSSPPPPPPVDNFDNFPTISDNIGNFPTGLNNRGACPPPAPPPGHGATGSRFVYFVHILNTTFNSFSFCYICVYLF